MASVQLIACLLVCTAFVKASKLGLPSWMVPCYRDDPNFNACALKNGREALPTLVLGDKKFRAPVLDPLEVTELRVDKEATKLGIGFTLRDIKLTGLAQSQLRDYRVDFENRHISFVNYLPVFSILSSYEISGKILILPITGHGPANITCENAVITYGIDYEIEKRKNGKNYMSLKNSKLFFNTTKAYIHLDNLFNGEKLLGENMNIFLNDNWEELIRELGPAVSEALGEVVKQVFTQLCNIIPFDDAHPLKPQ